MLKGTRYTYRIDILDTFPEWCRIPVKSFMDRLIREFRSHSTARNYKFSRLRFCRFLITNGINGFDKVTIAHTMIEMAKAHNLNIYEYLKYVLEQRPDNIWTDEQLSELAPWSEQLQSIKKSHEE